MNPAKSQANPAVVSVPQEHIIIRKQNQRAIEKQQKQILFNQIKAPAAPTHPAPHKTQPGPPAHEAHLQMFNELSKYHTSQAKGGDDLKTMMTGQQAL